jgi:hypothetical protein
LQPDPNAEKLHRVIATGSHTSVGSSSRWRWWVPALAILVAGSGTTVAYQVWSDHDSSATKVDCRKIDVRPLARLLGAGMAVPIEEDPDNGSLTCAFRLAESGNGDLGAGLVTIVATTSDTPEQARDDFDRTDGPEGKEIDGIGERTTLLVMPVSSDAPDVMTNYVLHVLDGNLVLGVSLQALSTAVVADQTSVQRALINVARDARSALD